jgi:hypothetical protein
MATFAYVNVSQGTVAVPGYKVLAPSDALTFTSAQPALDALLKTSLDRYVNGVADEVTAYGGAGVNAADLAAAGGLPVPNALYRTTSPAFVPNTNDYAGIIAAYNAAVAAGGGTIQLLPVTYNIGANYLPLTNNIQYVGAGSAYNTNNSALFGNGGTLIKGDGTTNCFQYNATDLGASPGAANIQLAQIGAVRIKDIAITNFQYGIKIGALYNGGCSGLRLDNITAFGCYQWGIWVENCDIVDFGTLTVAGNGVGNFYMGASGSNGVGGGSAWNFGDCAIKAIMCQAGASGIGMLGSIKSQGVVFECRGSGSALNDVQVGHLGINGWGGAIYSATSAITSGNANIPVSDLSKFAVASGVTFSGTIPTGLTANIAYFVTSVSGTSGAGTIQISNTVGGTVITPTSTSTPTLTCRGGTLLRIGASYANGTTPAIPASTCISVLHADVEQPGTVGILMQNCGAGHLLNVGSQINNLGLVLRNVNSYNTIRAEVMPKLDVDGLSRKVKYFGTRPTTVYGTQPGGLMWVDSTDGMGIGLTCVNGELDFYGGDSSGYVSLNLNTPLAMYHQQQPSSTSMYSSGPKQNTGQVITYTGAGGGNLTLPALAYAYQLGLPIYISNPSAGALTINTSSSQTIVGAGASGLTYVIPANTNAMFMGRQNGSTYYWGLNG